MKNTGAVILAAGKGSRFGGPKQHIQIDGVPLWGHVKATATSVLPGSCVVVVGIDIPGGATRTASVQAGLNHLASKGLEQVAILEAARPLLTRRQLADLVSAPGESKTFTKPLVNTVIMKNKSYLNRDEMLELLTPQCFDFQLLKHALDSGTFTDVTDETRIMWEYHQIPPIFLDGGNNLVKITYPSDLHVIRRLVEEKQCAAA